MTLFHVVTFVLGLIIVVLTAIRLDNELKVSPANDLLFVLLTSGAIVFLSMIGVAISVL